MNDAKLEKPPIDEENVTEEIPNAAAPSASESFSEYSHDMREKIEHRYREIEHQVDQTKQNLQKFNDNAAQFVRENPGWCILGAVTAGYIIGRMASKRWFV